MLKNQRKDVFHLFHRPSEANSHLKMCQISCLSIGHIENFPALLPGERAISRDGVEFFGGFGCFVGTRLIKTGTKPTMD